MYNDTECIDDNRIAEVFVKYFLEVEGNKEAEILQTSFGPLSLILTKSESKFFNSVSTTQNEKKIIENNV